MMLRNITSSATWNTKSRRRRTLCGPSTTTPSHPGNTSPRPIRIGFRLSSMRPGAS
ncbi:Uncharacterized protein DAT39_018954 [Clarias magur]|uniref:Uncharacterized protein n=1 Tax=Clarias magur TaxID=1594786 RepID=A0A8J4TTC3_CLAMG|nr:Uncharacterized protein DAT39_018954 [Clarias magur]